MPPTPDSSPPLPTLRFYFRSRNLICQNSETTSFISHSLPPMAAASLTVFRPSTIRSSIRPEPNNRKQVSTNWWAPLFGMSSEPDYIDGTAISSSSKAVEASGAGNEPVRARSKFAPGCFTEEKAKQLRMKTLETSTFHDIMYHSAIASRLASDVSKRFEK